MCVYVCQVFYSPTDAHSPWNNSLVDDALSVIKGEELAPYDLNKVREHTHTRTHTHTHG